jgi:hypothetical protein
MIFLNKYTRQVLFVKKNHDILDVYGKLFSIFPLSSSFHCSCMDIISYMRNHFLLPHPYILVSLTNCLVPYHFYMLYLLRHKSNLSNFDQFIEKEHYATKYMC